MQMIITAREFAVTKMALEAFITDCDIALKDTKYDRNTVLDIRAASVSMQDKVTKVINDKIKHGIINKKTFNEYLKHKLQ